LSTKIRLKRIGRRNRPFYRVVVMDSRNRRDGAAIEELGWFNPIEADKPYELKEDRILHWLQLGAQPSDALHGLMKRSGLAHRWHLTKQGLDEKAIEKEMKKWAMTREETLKNRADKAEEKAKKAKEKAKEKANAAAEAPVEEAPAEEAPKEESPKEEAPAEDVPKEEEPKEEAPAEDAPKEEEPKEESSKEEAPAEDAPKEEKQAKKDKKPEKKK